MSIFKRKPARPRFGVVAAPSQPAVATVDVSAVERGYTHSDTVDPRAHGMVPRAEMRTDLSGPDPVYDAVVASAARGDWVPARDSFHAIGRDWERREQLVQLLGRYAEKDEVWLLAWLAAEPNNPAALCCYAEQLTMIAWAVRSGDWTISHDQAEGFHRLLGQAQEVAERSTLIAPDDPTGLIRMIATARGLDRPNEDFATLWRQITDKAPQHVGAHRAALMYWLPRWQGSPVRLAEFVETAIALAPTGSLLTTLRLDWIFFERTPKDAAESRAFLSGPEVTAAVDATLRDIAAARPGHPQLARARSLVAYYLIRARRHPEALEQFRLVGGYVHSWPWTGWDDPVTVFCRYRADAILGSASV